MTQTAKWLSLLDAFRRVNWVNYPLPLRKLKLE